MTRILLIRHGAAEFTPDRLYGRTPGIGLSVEGRRRTRSLAQALSERSFDAIYSSPLQRALETAQAIAEPHAAAVVEDERLLELDFGAWTLRRFDELASDPLWREYNRSRSFHAPPGGETPLAVITRGERFLADVVLKHPDGEVAAVTHADVIRSILTLLLGMPLDHLLRIEIDPSSVTDVSMGGVYPLIHSVNRTYTQQN